MTHEQTVEEIRHLKDRFDLLSKSVDMLNANLLLKTAQFNQLLLLLGNAIASSGADKIAGVNFEEKFNEAVRERLHQIVLEMGDDGSQVSGYIQRILNERGILPDTYGIGAV